MLLFIMLLTDKANGDIFRTGLPNSVVIFIIDIQESGAHSFLSIII